MKYCPKCNSEYEDDVNFCKHDGTPLETKVEKVAEGKKCPQCGKLYPEDDGFCSVCGVKLIALSDGNNHCPECGAELSEGAKFCSKCGASVLDKSMRSPTNKKNIKESAADDEAIAKALEKIEKGYKELDDEGWYDLIKQELFKFSADSVKDYDDRHPNAMLEFIMGKFMDFGEEKYNNFHYFIKSFNNGFNPIDIMNEISMKCHLNDEELNFFENILETVIANGGDDEKNLAEQCSYVVGSRLINKNDTVQWYIKLWNKYKMPNTLVQIAACYLYGIGTQKDESRAFDMLCQAAHDYDIADAYYYLGLCYKYSLVFERELDAKLSELFYFSDDVADYQEAAFKLFKRAIKKGCLIPNAKIKLGDCYLMGEGCTQNGNAAYQNYHEASYADITGYADYMTGFCRENGIGCDDKSKQHITCDHYRTAYEKGSLDGMFKWGWCLYTGFGCETNVPKGLELIKKASDLGVEAATEFLNER